MKKLFACLLIVGTSSMASAQVSNFTGFSGAVNLSASSSNTKVGPSVSYGGDGFISSFQGAYGMELSSSSVLGFGLTYAAGKSKSGNTTEDDDSTSDVAIKNQYSLYLEPGALLSENTLVFTEKFLSKEESFQLHQAFQLTVLANPSAVQAMVWVCAICWTKPNFFKLN